MAHMLGNSEGGNLFMGDIQTRPPGYSHSWMDLNLPLGGPYTKKLPQGFNGYLNDNIDIFPPGWREQMRDPSRPYLGPYRSNLFQRNDTSINNVPILNYGAGVPDFIKSPWAQRYGSAMYEVLAETPVKEHWLFRDFGQYAVPYTGFTAIKDIDIGSTRGSML